MGVESSFLTTIEKGSSVVLVIISLYLGLGKGPQSDLLHTFFPVPCLFAPKAQKGIDTGKKSTRFWKQCIVG